MIHIGKWNRLQISKERSVGYFFDGGSDGDILMPQRHQPDTPCEVGDEMDVFIFHDAEGRLTATVRKPYAQVGEVAWLKVVDTHRAGAFLDWGMTKDLLVPLREQHEDEIMEVGEHYLVYIHLDAFDKIVGTAKLEEHLFENGTDHFEEGEAVSLVIAESNPLGYKAVVNHTHWGLLYGNEVFQPLKVGQSVSGYVKKIREDGKIDLALNKPGYSHERMDQISQTILDRIRAEGGFLPLTDKSPPEAIYNLFQISKKNFKQAVGRLYKARLITIEPQGLRSTGKPRR
ncbi:MAG: S1 RNA-binding domain-containing protein [Candidatus Sericytochromatia bacterium]